MRPPENLKSNGGIKVPSTTKEGPLIRLPIKKIYCSKCQRLIRGQTQGSNGTVQVICPRCGQTLWFRKSILWRSGGNGANAAPESAR